MMRFRRRLACVAAFIAAGWCAYGDAIELVGVTVTPHFASEALRYRVDPEPAAGARVQWFVRAAENSTGVALGAGLAYTVNGQTPEALLEAGKWAWHDFPPALPEKSIGLAPGELTVLTFNSRVAEFGPGATVPAAVAEGTATLWDASIEMERPSAWLSAVTFLASGGGLHPDAAVIHIANNSDEPLTVEGCRFWLPRDRRTPRTFSPASWVPVLTPFRGSSTIPPGGKGGFNATVPPLPLTYAVIETTLADPSGRKQVLWGHMRVKAETFDISGGWVQPVTSEAYLKTLHRLHVNTGHLKTAPGYTDTELYRAYPMKYFGDLRPFETYDVDAVLPRIHAAEFLGEPQYGGGRPVPPQEVWRELQAYAASRIATTLTHSEERIWRDYAGLSDYPHYDAYRVSAPSADAWGKYDRWDGKRIFWGAPLETIGAMSRSLRELNRPMPCAVWSQGPHSGWDVYGGRKRTSPTADELRVQAYHALSARVTSLYWFNLSAESLAMWRDTLDELGRIGRELRLIDEFLLTGDGYSYERAHTPDGAPDWDLSTVCGPDGALLFAVDLAYTADVQRREFVFGPPRAARFRFPLPVYLADVVDVFRLDADGLHSVPWTLEPGAVIIEEPMTKAAVYVAAPVSGTRERLEAERQALIAREDALGFDPARNDDHFAELRALVTAP